MSEERCFDANQSELVSDRAQRLREQIMKRREKLATSWASPLFMVFVALLFGPCMLNAITQFLTSWIESIKLHMLIVQQRPLNDAEL